MTTVKRQWTFVSLLISCVLLAACEGSSPRVGGDRVSEWNHYGNGIDGKQHSMLDQITPDNIDRLELAWEYRVPHAENVDLYEGLVSEASALRFQFQPLAVNERVYVCSPTGFISSLDPQTGTEQWRYDVNENVVEKKPLKCRALAYWQQDDANSGFCSKRLFLTSQDQRLLALDADSGKPCQDFGEGGSVALDTNIANTDRVYYHTRSVNLVVGDTIIIGSSVDDNIMVDAPAGVVRAYDARSGALRWAWNPVPPGGQPIVTDENGQQWYKGGTPNSWSRMSADPELGLLYVPTGNPSPDLYGGERDGSDYYGSSVVALSLETGEVAWHFQTVHHDVWDYDVGSIPALFQHKAVGGGARALAQPTKTGHIFLLDRETGEPLYPVEERPVPQNGVPGEKLSPTQPFPTHPKPIHEENPEPWGFTPFDKSLCKKEMEKYRWDGPYTPPSLEGSLQFPGASGGVNWGSAAIDQQRGLLTVIQTHMPWVIQLIPREEMKNYKLEDYGFPNQLFMMEGTPYGAMRFPLLGPLGAPCNQTPWGSLTTVDLVSGEVLWKKPLGTTRDLAPFPLWLNIGTPNLGGLMSTASGIVFATGTTDHFVRAFQVETGEEIWRRRTVGPVGASPMTYRLAEDQKQYVVFAVRERGSSPPAYRFSAYALED